MKFSYNWLQDFFEDKLPKPTSLADLLTLHSFEVETVKKSFSDYIFDIDITPNRADCLSHQGIALEISAITGLRVREEKLNLKIKKENRLKIDDFVKIKVENKKDCLRYTGCLIQGVKIKESPQYIQKRLKSLGLEPINNIVDAANYAMLETGQPLHAFDFDKIEGKEIIVRRAKKGEKLEGLDENRYQLDSDILVIADFQKPLAIAGIKGGKNSCIDNNTKNIFIEGANFDSVLIRKASQKLKLKTDASLRFEHGLYSELTEKGVNFLALLIQNVAGGKIVSGRLGNYSKKNSIKKIKLNFDKIENLLGIKIEKTQAKSILKRLGFKFSKKDIIIVPNFRKDVTIEEDLIEEIGRIYGYNNLKESFPKLALIPAKKNYNIFWQNRVKSFFKENGFLELYNYSFISEKIGKNFGGPLVELKNPYSKEFYYLRPNLLLNILSSAKENLKIFNSIRVYEIGRVFRNKKDGINEETNLAGLINEDFYTLKGLIDSLLDSLSLAERFYDNFQATPDESEMLYWDIKNSAEIKLNNGEEIGFIGKISDITLRQFDLKGNFFAFEIDFEKLLKHADEENEYQPISKFPSAIRDIAILVPIGTKVAEILNVLNQAGGKLLKDVDLFDIFEGENIPEGKKNLAFHLIFQSSKKTLSFEEIDNLYKKIIRALEKKYSWQIRN
jgi:phenylalanyl-tRNA synthetase beta chain